MGVGMPVGADVLATTTMGFGSSTAMTASTHKVVINGVVPKSGEISSVGFRFGAVTKGVTTELLVSLQNLDLANGPPARPDGTVDQSGTVSSGSIVSNAFVTVTLSTSRTVTVGDLLAVVLEFNTFNASDSITVASLVVVAGAISQLSVVSHYNGTAWTATTTQQPILTLGYSDGTVTSFLSTVPTTSITSSAFSSSSSPNERGIRWVPTARQIVVGLWTTLIPSADHDMVLYDSAGNELGVISVDANIVRTSALRPQYHLFSSPVTVTADATYYLTIRPTTTTNITVYTCSLNAAADREAWPLGTEADGATRTGTGAWTISSTSRLPILPIIDFAATVALPVVRVI